MLNKRNKSRPYASLRCRGRGISPFRKKIHKMNKKIKGCTINNKLEKELLCLKIRWTVEPLHGTHLVSSNCSTGDRVLIPANVPGRDWVGCLSIGRSREEVTNIRDKREDELALPDARPFPKIWQERLFALFSLWFLSTFDCNFFVDCFICHSTFLRSST